ncbi:hypothetical protein DOTSEDRAFT_34950 [Dothistroma septosporum NZE10]|uniref:Heterokaryon incompatibility domain-containing protein n=1 Tax=Dothistroma septosporum (strain NZE10 / CBS 128990) TaxID=675120 RepID=N1PMC5_DOTSN|nr:hypothetical protein DOTSEDRAFT_34950 [Dothistroma septosporum NZE10]
MCFDNVQQDCYISWPGDSDLQASACLFGQGLPTRTTASGADTAPLATAIRAHLLFLGDLDTCSYIIVGGHRVKVPIDTERALRCMAAETEHESTTLWIDVVCIDQHNRVERQHQVGMMREVYPLCPRTRVYLGPGVYSQPVYDSNDTIMGPENNKTQRAADHIYALHRKLMEDVQTAGRTNVADLVFRSGESAFNRAGGPPQTPLDEEALAHLYDSPWSSVQVELQKVLDVAIWLREYRRNHLRERILACEGLESAASIWRIREMSTADGSVMVCNLMIQTQESEALYSYGKIFGTLGLHTVTPRHPETSSLLAVDYGKSDSEVMRDATRYSIVNDGNDGGSSGISFLGAQARSISIVVMLQAQVLTEQFLTSCDFPPYSRAIAVDLTPDQEDACSLLYHGNKVTLWPAAMALVKSVQSTKSRMLRGRTLSLVGQLLPSRQLRTLDFAKLLKCSATIHKITSGTTSNIRSNVARTLLADTNDHRQRSIDSELVDFDAFRKFYAELAHIKSIAELRDDDNHLIKVVAHCRQTFTTYTQYRRFCISANGLMGFVPQITRTADMMVLLNGGELPSVLRPQDDQFLIIGMCYIDGAMYW